MNRSIDLRSLVRASKLACAAVVALLCSTLVMVALAEPAAAAETACSRSLQAKIDAAPAGGTVTADACVYREQVRVTKPLTLVGQQGTEIRGSDVWGGWTRLASGDFTNSKSLPKFPQEDVSCDRGTLRCAWPEQVFVNGVEQQQVGPSSDPTAGQFKVTEGRRVVLGSDPTGKTVEVTVRRHWITGSSAADGVNIRGFIMRHAANEWRSGAIQSREPTTANSTSGSYSWGRFKADGEDWNLLGNTLLRAHGAIISVRGPNANIEGNKVAFGGQLGIHNPGNGGLVKSNDIHHNNIQGFCSRFGYCSGADTDGNGVPTASGDLIVESGGIKVAGGRTGVDVSANLVHDNLSHGVWFDEDGNRATVSDNRIFNNKRIGVFFEISEFATISGNVIYGNGFGSPQSVDGAGIQIGNSDDAEVFNNTLAWNADGLIVRCLDRRDDETSTCQRNFVRDNIVLQANTSYQNDGAAGLAVGFVGNGGPGSSTNSLYDPANKNVGVGNDYYYTYSEDGRARFAWNSQHPKLTGFNATPGEEGGRYLTQSQKDAVVASKGVPATPAPR